MESQYPEKPALDILDPRSIRLRCENIFNGVDSGDSRCFKVNRDYLPVACNEVTRLIRSNYPDLKVPYHSRWRHFEVSGRDLSASLLSGAECRLSAEIELVVISVLLDAGAGNEWVYYDNLTQQSYTRSEGLAIASLACFSEGLFSSLPGERLRADGVALTGLSVNSLAKGFHARSDNPLIGIESRVSLLNRLGKLIIEQKGPDARLSDLFSPLTQTTESIRAGVILRTVLLATGSIWPRSKTIGSATVADVWAHRNAGGAGDSTGYVPFHKLSQWLSYSLLEPLERQGIQVTHLEDLTGLPEYRNGGLFIDTGVLVPLNAEYFAHRYEVDSEFVVEWRAMTVTLLDMLATAIRTELNLSSTELPLAAVLQGGTWSAGRALAQRKRNGLPPVEVISDGTVF